MKYEVNGKEYDVYSSANQRILDKFVNKEVYANVTDMVEFILQNSYGDTCGEAPFTNDDITNAYVDNSDEIEELKEDIEELEDKQCETSISEEEYDFLEGQINRIYDKISELENEQDEPNEVFSWYLVSGWLCDKLKDRGEVVIEHENLWGRGCCGQAISLDWVIGDICKDIEILEGQSYSWAE